VKSYKSHNILNKKIKEKQYMPLKLRWYNGVKYWIR